MQRPNKHRSNRSKILEAELYERIALCSERILVVSLIAGKAKLRLQWAVSLD
jgi:hypothetical protein